MQLNPRESFAIVRQIEDHTDSATYYVRAVIRNAKTDAIIQVNGNNYLNLSDKGSQRFAADWLVSADPSGQGFYVNILTSVYTDSGYTTKSQNYGDKMETYLVQDRQPFNPNYPTGPDIDYKKIKSIVDDVVKLQIKKIKIPQPKAFPVIPKVDVLGPVEALGKALVAVIKENRTNETSLKPVLDLLAEVKTSVEGGHSKIHETTTELTKIVVEGVEALSKDMEVSKEEICEEVDGLAEKIRVEVFADEINKAFDSKTFDLKVVTSKPEPVVEREKKDERVNKFLKR